MVWKKWENSWIVIGSSSLVLLELMGGLGLQVGYTPQFRRGRQGRRIRLHVWSGAHLKFWQGWMELGLLICVLYTPGGSTDIIKILLLVYKITYIVSMSLFLSSFKVLSHFFHPYLYLFLSFAPISFSLSFLFQPYLSLFISFSTLTLLLFLPFPPILSFSYEVIDYFILFVFQLFFSPRSFFLCLIFPNKLFPLFIFFFPFPIFSGPKHILLLGYPSV